ncbi:MAG: cytochrome P450, partial [Microthrixaceae bacterium]
VPQSESTRIAPLVNDGTRLIDAAADEEAIAKGEQAAGELAEYFVNLAEKKRADPDDGLFSALIELRAEGDRLSEEELIANTTLMYAAGVDTTSNLIGNGMRLLLANPDQLAILRRDRSLLPSAIWEMLRHDSPVQLNVRAVLESVEILDMELERGAMFLVLQGSGNHDEEAYEDSAAFDVARFSGPDGSVPTPLSFGWGPHHCLGAHLARAEAEIVFGAILDAFESIELDTDALVADGNDTGRPHFRSSFTIRGLESLPVRVTAA